MKKKEIIMMLGTSLESRWGMAESEKVILENWNSDQFDLKLVVTHRFGNALIKIQCFLSGLLQFISDLFINQTRIIFVFLSVGASFYRKSVFILISKLFRKKIVISSRGGGFDNFYNNSPVFLKRYIKLILNLANVNIVLGESEKILFNKISGHDRCTVIHNSIVCPKLSASLDVRPWVVCTMSHLSHAKGTFDLFEAIPLVLQEYPEVEFWFCGDGDLARVNNVIKNKGLEQNVKLLGYIVGSEKEEVYLRSVIYVLPSYYEGMPRSLLEAMSYGLPVVTTHVNGIPDLVQDGVTGLLIEPGDINALAQKIIMLLREEHIRTELGNNARSHVSENFNVDAKLLELESQFKGLI